jgi:hypothetical protein
LSNACNSQHVAFNWIICGIVEWIYCRNSGFSLEKETRG